MRSEASIYKFGGASVKDASGVRNAAGIVTRHGNRPIVIVVSAMGKMTNAFEGLARAFYDRSGDVDVHFEKIRSFHSEIAFELFDPKHEVFGLLNDHFVEIEWIVEDEPDENFDFVYDQLVSLGEMLSTRIISAHFEDQGLEPTWLDVRDVLKTDNTYREAHVDWVATQKQVDRVLVPLMHANACVVTQGFIGCTSENFTSTLGREGSDYTAAVLANCLGTREMTIWKDVPGVLTADPKAFENVQLIERMTYREAVEMTYYGAKVIHPKTIKPLQNKQIPLYVRSFEDPEQNGTWIGTDLDAILPPIIVHDPRQALVHIAVRDYSFVAEHHLSELFALFAKCRIKINLMRNTAISFVVCCTDHPDRIAAFQKAVSDNFNVVVDTKLSLYTIRHANPATVELITKDKIILMEERFKDTVQFVVKDVVVVAPKTP